jgi:hypothetical protein
MFLEGTMSAAANPPARLDLYELARLQLDTLWTEC